MEVAISVKEMIDGGGDKLVKIADIFCLILCSAWSNKSNSD